MKENVHISNNGDSQDNIFNQNYMTLKGFYYIMENKLKGKVALITGSSSGIGKAVALKFAKEGADVIITSTKKTSDLGEQVKKEAISYGVRAIYISADFRYESEIENLFAEIKKQFGKLDILVNNAGLQTGGDINSVRMEEFNLEMQVNVSAVVKCSQEAKKLMEDKGWIINTSSIRGLDYAGRASIMGYSASKAALNNLTKTMALNFAPNIFVNAVMPGFVYTQNYDKFDADLKENWINNTPIGRFITPNEIADVYVFLATTEILTGSIIVADGGISLLNR